MQVDANDDQTTIRLSQEEREFLILALRRASFEDTPVDRQRAVLDFALALRRLAGDGDPEHGG